MKKILTLFFALCLWIQAGFSQVYLDQFAPSMGTIGGSPATAYTSVVSGGEWAITGGGAATNAGGFNTFTYYMSPTVNATGNNKVYVRAKASVACNLRMDIQDAAGYTTSLPSLNNNISTSYAVYEYNFTGQYVDAGYGGTPCAAGPCPVNGALTQQLLFYVNAGTGGYGGTITIDYISFGSQPPSPGVTYAEHFATAAAASAVVYTAPPLTSAWSTSSEIILRGNGATQAYGPAVLQMRDALGNTITNGDITLTTGGLMANKLYVRARSTVPGTSLRIDLEDQNGFQTSQSSVTQAIGTNYTDYVFDFTSTGYVDGGYGGTACAVGPCPVDPTRIKQVFFYINPGVGNFGGDLIIDYISFGKPQTATTYTPLIANSSKTNVLCNGAATGAITMAVTGGSGVYTYNWGGGIISPNRTGLAAGAYTVTVTDIIANQTATSTISITQPATTVSATSNTTDVLCNGGNNGSIVLSASGGAPGYTFNWGGGITGNTRFGLSAGTYTATVTDANLCTFISSTVVTQPTVLAATASTFSAGCAGATNGNIDVTTTGGTPFYSFLWSNGSIGEDLNNVAAGTYTLVITDDNGCTASLTRTVSQNALIVPTATSTNVPCFGGTTGTINLAWTGGTPSFSFNWGGGIVSQNRTGLAAGTYTVTITDGIGCTATLSRTITQPAALTVNATVVNPVCGGTTGSITLAASGGTGTYTYNWGGSITGATRTGLAPGTYSATVTDANNCTKTVSSTILPAVVLAASASSTNVACFGTNTGAINLTVNTGTSPYTFNWGGGITSEDRTGLAAGTYSIVVTDANNCTFSLSETITQPTALMVTASVTNPDCTTPTGSIALSATGGTGAYTYNWGGGITGATRTGLTSGIYTATVTDANNCTKTISATIPPSSVLTATIIGTNLTCFGAPTGAINVSVTSGSAPYSYNWGGGITSEDRTGLAAGTYTVLVTDANGCITSLATTITQPTALSIIASAADANCGNADGSITLIPSGGTGAYSYNWNGGFSGATRTGLTAGTYIATVSDANGCSQEVTTTIASIGSVTASISGSNVACFGGTDGAINLTVNIGTAPYTYNWGGGITSEDRTGLTAGTYTVLVTDANGCTASLVQIIAQPNAALSASAAVNNVNCFGESNGSIALAASGGTPNYTYNWGNGNTSQNYTGLAAGTFTATVTDNNGCSTTTTNTVTQPSMALSATMNGTNITCNGASNGLANVVTNGGTSPYTYIWSVGATNEYVGSLDVGTYNVSITDANNCATTASIAITQPDILVTSSVATAQSSPNVDNGTATVSVTGGSAPYSYVWSNGENTATISNLAPGTYSVIVTDASGCTSPQSVTVNTFSCAIVASVEAFDSPCFGTNSGFASVILQNATEPVTYNWSNGGFTRIVSQLAPNNYTVSVTDANGCPGVVSFTISQPTQFFANATSTPQSVLGTNDGTATVTPTGGTGTFFLYEWSTGATTQTITGLSAGVYMVTVIDANGCPSVETIVVGIVAGCATTTIATAQNVTCAGAANGQAAVEVVGGVAPIVYTWSNGGNTASISGLSGGVYSVNTTDLFGCENSTTVTILEPTALAAALSGIVNVQCPNEPTGVANYIAQGGTSPYTYSWSNGSTGSSVGNLLPGAFSVVATDANGCTTSANGTITVEDTQIPVLSCPSNILRCNGDNVVTYQLPTAADNCNIAGGVFGFPGGLPSGSAFPLGTTTQSFTFTDASGNVGSCSFNVTVSSTIVTENTLITAATGAQNNGAINITVSGGLAPYTYTWTKNGTSIPATTQDLTGLGAGTYVAIVTDANGCTKSTGDIVVNAIIGTSTPEWVNGMVMSPNPTTGLVQLRFANIPTGELMITVFDATGRILDNQTTLNVDVVNLDLTGLPDGVYSVRMLSAGQVAVRSLVVSK
jgi:hypothetical protein